MTQSRNRARRSSFAIVAGLCIAAGPPPARLLLADAGHARGLAYVADFGQSLSIDVAGGTMEAQRSFRIRGHIEQATALTGDSVLLTVKLDSARASAVQHDTRQILDARQLPGAAIELAYARAGGRPAWRTTPPSVDFGEMIEGPVPVSIMLDPLFIPMPDHAVEAGATWEREWRRDWLDGRTPGEQRMRVRFRFERIEKAGRASVARIAISSPADPAGPTGYALVGIEDGVVHEVSIDAVSSATLEFGADTFPYRQTSTLRIALAGGSSR
jgi:hypothetical protein